MNDNDNNARLTSRALAELLVDTLCHNDMLRCDHAEKAVLIMCDEIDARKVLGDY